MAVLVRGRYRDCGMSPVFLCVLPVRENKIIRVATMQCSVGPSRDAENSALSITVSERRRVRVGHVRRHWGVDDASIRPGTNIGFLSLARGQS